MTNGPSHFERANTANNANFYKPNDQLQIHNDLSGFIGGDTDLNIYVGATLIKY